MIILLFLGEVSCGNFKAGSCAACEQVNGASWCKGIAMNHARYGYKYEQDSDCHWINGECVSKSKLVYFV